MKYLLLLSTLTLSLMFSSASSAEWTEVVASTSGTTFYVDLDRVRKNNGYMYVWSLTDYIKPGPNGTLSAKAYKEVDCKGFRQKSLTYIYYKQPMGEGGGDSDSPSNPEWEYPPPDSNLEGILNKVCAP